MSTMAKFLEATKGVPIRFDGWEKNRYCFAVRQEDEGKYGYQRYFIANYMNRHVGKFSIYEWNYSPGSILGTGWHYAIDLEMDWALRGDGVSNEGT